MSALLISTPEKEGSYESAKWLKWPVLAGVEEFEALFAKIPQVELYSLGSIRALQEVSIKKKAFLGAIQQWNDQLSSGLVPSLGELRSVLGCAMTLDSESLWLQSVPNDRFLVKIRRPVIQMQAYFFSYSSDTDMFHSMSLGSKSIFWGIQFSYPQLFIDPSGDVCKVGDSFANTCLMKTVRQWVRDWTLPAVFMREGNKKAAPMRWGKSLSSWIGRHPQFSLCSLEWGK